MAKTKLEKIRQFIKFLFFAENNNPIKQVGLILLGFAVLSYFISIISTIGIGLLIVTVIPLVYMVFYAVKWLFKHPRRLAACFNIFQGEHHILFALIIGGLVVGYAISGSVFIDNQFFPLFAEQTPMKLLPFVIVEELAKVLGIYLLISTRKNVSGLSVVLIPTTVELFELIKSWFYEGDIWGILFPFHVITGIIYLRFLRISKKMLFVAFIVNSLLHWIWNIQATMVDSFPAPLVELDILAWIILAVYVFRTQINKTENSVSPY